MARAKIRAVFCQKIGENQKRSSPEFEFVFVLKLGENHKKVLTGISAVFSQILARAHRQFMRNSGYRVVYKRGVYASLLCQN